MLGNEFHGCLTYDLDDEEFYQIFCKICFECAKKFGNCSGLLPAFSVCSRMPRGLWLVVIALLIVSTLCGCNSVRRKMTINTNPPDAAVFLDGKELGRTPFTANFDHYGKREFRIVKPGYETKTELVPVRAPWYQWVGFDFVSEVLLPGKLTDRKFYEFSLQPERIVPPSEIVSRAEQFRQTAHADGVPRIGGSASAIPSLSPVPSSGAGSLPFPVPAFAPIVPTETLLVPPSMPSNPNTYVPPTL